MTVWSLIGMDSANLIYNQGAYGPGCAFSGRPGRLEMLVGYWKAFQWSPTWRVEIKLTLLWW